MLANRPALVGVVAIDTWTTAHDGRQARALLTTTNEYQVFAVDFGHNFGPGTWDAATLVAHPAPTSLVDPNGWLAAVPSGTGPAVATRVRAVTDDDLRQLIGAIPAAWGLHSEDGEALFAFLSGRREAVAHLLDQMG
jgi:hypothetical protein